MPITHVFPLASILFMTFLSTESRGQPCFDSAAPESCRRQSLLQCTWACGICPGTAFIVTLGLFSMLGLDACISEMQPRRLLPASVLLCRGHARSHRCCSRVVWNMEAGLNEFPSSSASQPSFLWRDVPACAFVSCISLLRRGRFGLTGTVIFAVGKCRTFLI